MSWLAATLCLALLCAIGQGLQDAAGVSGALETRDIAIPAGRFHIGQRVQVRDLEGEEWKVGIVSSLRPFRVTPDGWDTAFRWKYIRPGVAQHRTIVKPAVVDALDPTDALQPQLPDEPGCYVWMPSGCPKNVGFRASVQWHRDEYGEEHGALSKQACSARARSFNSWCGVTDARMHLVLPKAPPAPVEPGCYVRHPTGCSKQNVRGQNSWKRDVHGEETLHAAESRTVCEVDRKRMFDSWCGSEDTDMLFVDKDGHSGAPATPMLAPLDVHDPSMKAASSPEAQVVREPGTPELPGEPGCFVWMPSGCPRTRSFKATAVWKRDEYGEQEKGARVSKKACQARASSFNSWCGATDARIMFIASPPPAAPTTPGCYVFHRSGCPRQSMRVHNEWQRDVYGEGSLNATELKDVCEIERKRSFDAWCGVDDTAMMFVPKTVELQSAEDPAAESVPTAGESTTGAEANPFDLALDRSVKSSQDAASNASKTNHTDNVSSYRSLDVVDETTTTEALADRVSGAGEVAAARGNAWVAGASRVVGQRITNLNGQEYQLRQPGNYTLLELPRDGAPALVVKGSVEAMWPCTLFVRAISISGGALGKDILQIHTGSQRRGVDAALHLETWKDGSWMPVANVSRDSREKLDATSGMMAMTYKAEENSVKVFCKNGQVGEEAGLIDIQVGDIAIHVSLRGSKKRTHWLNVAVEGSGTTAPVGNSSSLAGLLARNEPDPAWLEPTEACTRRLGRNVKKVRTTPSIAS